MNTLVDLKDGAAQVPATDEKTGPSAPEDAALAPRPSDATLIEAAPPPSGAGAATATLIELAPASGRTMILPDGAGNDARRAWVNLATVPEAPAPRAAGQ